MSPRGRRCVVALLASAAAATVPSAAAAQGPAPPSLRLFAAGDVTLSRADARLNFSPGLWVATVGGEFRLHVRRPDYRRWEVTQVDPLTGRTLRSIPARLLAGWDGLRAFVRVRLLDARRRVAARLTGNLCPGSFSGERVDDSGPRRSRYATGCGAGSPFLQGMVWGIDAGWATPALPPGRGVRVPPGRYTAIATITRPYRRAFAIPRADATATMRIRITAGASGGRRPTARADAAGPAPAARRATRVLAQADRATLPDLVALPAWNVTTRHRPERDLLRFSSTAWNAGPAALVVEGFRRPGRGTMDAYQYFVDAAGNVTGRAPAGTMIYERHGGHDHWHFQQFATYRLLDARRRAVVRATKQSFCLFPTDAIDLTVPGAALGFADPGISDGSVCGGTSSIWIRETLAAGWGDTYDRSVGGQAFNITTVPNGRYYIETRVNPGDLLQETTLANNVQLRRIRLGGRRGARTVRVMPWNGIRP